MLKAARDACDRMGNKKFYEQMIHDIIQQEKYGITSEADVTTLKDYMQVMCVLNMYMWLSFFLRTHHFSRKLVMIFKQSGVVFYVVLFSGL